MEVTESTYVTRKREVCEMTRGVGTHDVQEFFVMGVAEFKSDQNGCRSSVTDTRMKARYAHVGDGPFNGV